MRTCAPPGAKLAETWQTWTESWQFVDGESVTPGWHYVAVVQNAAQDRRTLYVDGVEQGSVVAHDASGNMPVFLGGTQGEPTENFPGSVDEARISSVARSAVWC